MKPTFEQIFKETKCPICGKLFCRTIEWAYKKTDEHAQSTYFCSWKCLRAYEAEHGEKKRKRIAVDQLTLDGDFIKTFDDIDDAAAAVDGCYDGIRIACKLSRKFKGYLWRYNTNDLSKVQQSNNHN